VRPCETALTSRSGSQNFPIYAGFANPGFLGEPVVIGLQIEQWVRAKNTALRRKLSRSALIPVGSARPV